MKFAIKPISGAPEKEGDTFVRWTGNAEPFNRKDQMALTTVGVELDGSDKVQYNTGLEPERVEFFGWLTEAQKAEHKKFIEDNLSRIEAAYGGKSSIDSQNKFFWRKPERSVISINNETENRIFDTKNIEHLMIYLAIMAGAFLEVVAPTQMMAEVKGIPHFIQLESDIHDIVADDYGTKADAFSNLRILDKEEGGDALLYLAWCLQSKSQGFGAYTRATPKRELLKYHGEFIEGKLTKTKRNCPKDFLTYSENWKDGGLPREAIQVEAYLKAAEYYSYLNVNRENRYELPSGIALGATIEDAVSEIRKPKNRKDLDSLRNFVEAKWKE